MTLQLNKLVIVFCVVLLTTGCRELVQNDFTDFENATTLNAILVSDSVVKVHVAITNKLSEDTLPVIEDAEVNLFVNNIFIESLTYSANGIYTANHIIKPLDSLRCEVTTRANGTTLANCIIPESTEFSDVKIFHNAWVNNEGRVCPAIEFTILNSLNKVKYYEARVYVLSGYGNQIEYYYYSDEFSLLLFSNINETDSIITKKVEFQLFSYGSDEKYAYILELRSVSQSYYNYAQSIVLYEQGRYPEFDVGTIVPYNLYSNVENGYGIFAGYSTHFSDTVY